MPVPDFQSLMLPTLTALSDGEDTAVAEVRQRAAATEGLTPEALHELLPSGKVTKFANRIGWALVHLQRAGLVEKVQRGIYRLAAAGEQLLVQSPTRIDMPLLRHSSRQSRAIGRRCFPWPRPLPSGCPRSRLVA